VIPHDIRKADLGLLFCADKLLDVEVGYIPLYLSEIGGYIMEMIYYE